MNLNLENLGRVGIAGDFSGISLYQFEGQDEVPFSVNGSESLLTQLPNGDFATILTTDASIQAMCNFVRSDGTVEGVVIGGNFTSLDGQESHAIALFNPNTTEVTSLDGLSGQVNVLLCDQEADLVYIGGNFKTDSSTNAIAWDGKNWTSLAFAGFNGPVTSITKLSNGNLVFGGSFTGLGNTTISNSGDDLQVINLAAANISDGNPSTTTGFNDPRNVVCKDNFASEGAGSTWLLRDNSAGSWNADFGFGFIPTKLRLYNTHLDGRGTKTWHFTVIPDNGIMNFTYIDPTTGQNMSCTNQCPLSDDTSIEFQDFFFVNQVGMDRFRIEVTEFYGAGGGFNGIQLFQDDIFSYAIASFNEGSCATSTGASAVTTTGDWEESPSFISNSKYLTASISRPITSNSATIDFFPDVKESGHYSVNMYTPGCIADNTCSTRGQVNITGFVSQNKSFQTTLYQTNNYDKYDQIYFGFIDASSFQPHILMTPLDGQGLDEMTFVAQRVGFTRINSTGGLNGLFEFDPQDTTIDSDDFSDSKFDTLSTGFSSGSAVNSLVTSGSITYIAGNFSSDEARNIVAVENNETKSLDGGLNGAVHSMYLNDIQLYIGGEFNNTLDGTISGLNNVAVYDTSSDKFSPLGAGLDGGVRTVVALKMNLTANSPEIVIGLTGDFKTIKAFGDNDDLAVPGFAVWVPSRSNWLQNLVGSVPGLSGIVSSSLLDLPGGEWLLAGSVASSQIGANGAASLSGNGDALGGFSVHIAPTSTSSAAAVQKREIAIANNITGVVTGAFYEKNNQNITVLAGHFDAKATNGSTIHNLVFIDGTDDDTVTGLGSEISEDAIFVAVGISGDLLFAGGNVRGTVNGENVTGLLTYNLADMSLGDQPPGLAGSNETVSVIAVRPNSNDVYVGGAFDRAGSLDCPGVCYYTPSIRQWNRPGTNLGGSAHCLMWSSETVLIAGGNLTVNNTETPLAKYDTDAMVWDSFPGSSSLPGPVEVLVPADVDAKTAWVAGHTFGSQTTYLMKYDGSNWQNATDILGDGTEIRSLQMFTLKESHDDATLVENDRVLMLTGHIVIPGYGSASAATYDGITLQAFALTASTGNTPGTISRIFSQNDNFFSSTSGNMPLVFVVLIGLAISLALIALLVISGVLLDRYRKKKDGYVPAPTSMYDRGSGIQRIPPAELLESLGKGKLGAPHV